MKTRVLDSWPVLEWILGKQPATNLVAGLFSEAEAGKLRLAMSAINTGEVYYFLKKHRAADLAASWRDSCEALPVTMDVPTAETIWRAAELKSRFAISYADAFAAELAQRFRCPLITGDPEFRSVDKLDLDWTG